MTPDELKVALANEGGMGTSTINYIWPLIEQALATARAEDPEVQLQRIRTLYEQAQEAWLSGKEDKALLLERAAQRSEHALRFRVVSSTDPDRGHAGLDQLFYGHLPAPVPPVRVTMVEPPLRWVKLADVAKLKPSVPEHWMLAHHDYVPSPDGICYQVVMRAPATMGESTVDIEYVCGRPASAAVHQDRSTWPPEKPR